MNLTGQVKSIKQVSYGITESNGKIIRDSTGVFSFTPVRLFTFDRNGNLTETLEDHSNGNIFRHFYKYDPDGKEIENIVYKPDGSIQERTFARYDEIGNKTEEEYSGFVNQKRTFKYNDKGYLVEENIYEYERKSNWKTIYTYDKKGNQIEQNHYRPNGQLNKNIACKYDDKGNQIELKQHNPSGKLLNKSTFKYDERNNRTEEIHYNPDGTIYSSNTYKYEYDDQNNWIIQVSYENVKPIIKVEREIEYYK